MDDNTLLAVGNRFSQVATIVPTGDSLIQNLENRFHKEIHLIDHI